MTTTTLILLTLVAGFLVGLAAAFVLRLVQAKTAKDLFLSLAKAKLDSAREGDANELDKKKALIDQQLQQMTAKLENVSTLMKDLEKDRSEKFGQLAGQLQTAGQQTQALLQTTNSLREALSSTKARGQWGERMAEDVLRLAGFIENVNYLKQKTIEGVGSRPDFTFLLPKSLKLHMDVKFPLDNYIRFLETDSDGEKAKFRSDFLRDARARVKEITTREYIDAESNTVDYVLLFIPTSTSKTARFSMRESGTRSCSVRPSRSLRCWRSFAKPLTILRWSEPPMRSCRYSERSRSSGMNLQASTISWAEKSRTS